MIRYIKQLGLFFFSLSSVCLILLLFQTWNIREQADFKFSNDYKYVQLGHSHAECAYNDSLIADFKNMATSGESYFYTYYKLKKILEQNSSLETVLIEFTNNQINLDMDTWIWGDKYISKFYPKYGSFLNIEDTGLLLKHNLSSLLNNFSVLQKRNFKISLSGNYSFIPHIGGYVYHSENDLEKARRVQNGIEDKNKEENYNDISETNISYLEKIVSLCKDYRKNIIFIRSPQHKELVYLKNESQFLHLYAQRFNEVPMIDFNDFAIPDSGFKDLSHLNYMGAKIISKVLDSLLKHRTTHVYSVKSNKRIIVSH